MMNPIWNDSNFFAKRRGDVRPNRITGMNQLKKTPTECAASTKSPAGVFHKGGVHSFAAGMEERRGRKKNLAECERAALAHQRHAD
jgi:hypothetical protein